MRRKGIPRVRVRMVLCHSCNQTYEVPKKDSTHPCPRCAKKFHHCQGCNRYVMGRCKRCS